MDNEWLKVILQFDINQQQTEDDDQDPWSQVRIIPDENEDVKLFGSYTILIHSIALFLIVTLLLSLLSICLINFFDYIPEQLRAIYLHDNPPNSTNDVPQDNTSMASSGN